MNLLKYVHRVTDKSARGWFERGLQRPYDTQSTQVD